MSRLYFFVNALMCFALAAALAPAQSATRPGPSAGYGSAQPGMAAPVVMTPSEDPKGSFIAAREAFSSGNYDSSARNLRQAADVLRQDASRARGKAADDLTDSARSLDKMADRIQRGDERNVDNLNDAVGDSYKALSNFHYQQARDSYERNRSAGTPAGRDVETGNYLNAAANDMESWAAYTGRKIQGGTRTAIDDTRDLAGKMISGTGRMTEKAAQGLDRFGSTIRDFGWRVEHRVHGGAGNPPPAGAPENKPITAPDQRE